MFPGIDGHPGDLAQMEIRRQFQKVGDRFVGISGTVGWPNAAARKQVAAMNAQRNKVTSSGVSRYDTRGDSILAAARRRDSYRGAIWARHSCVQSR